MKNAKKPTGYTVGYCKPPKSSQFKKGRSGNPKGRPKGALNSATVLERTLREPVVVNENGRRKEITKLEAIFKQLVNQSAGGDLAAIRQVLAKMLEAEGRSSQPPVQASADTEPDLELEGVKERLLAKLLPR